MDKQKKIMLVVLAGLILFIGGIFSYNKINSYIQDQNAKTATANQLIQEQKQAIADTQTKIDEIEAKNQAEVDSLTGKVASVDQKASQNDSDVTSIVNQWKNYIADVRCIWINEDITNEGSSSLIGNGTNVIVLTNAHVLTYDNTPPDYCVVGVYGVGGRTVQYSAKNFVYTQNQDTARIHLDDTLQATDNHMFNYLTRNSINMKVCDNNVEIGDKLVVLGYPVNGSPDGLTVTQGVVSGSDGDYWITDAKIDHGNSGGAAVLLKNSCWLGIPTWVQTTNGSFESYGRILKSTAVQ